MEEVETNVTNNEKIGKRNKKVWIIALVVIGALILAGIILLAFLLKPNPKLVFEYAIANTHKNAQEYTENYAIDIKDGFKSNGKISIESNIDGVKELNGLNLTYDYGTNIKDNNMEIAFNLDEKDQSMKGTLYIQDNKVYIDSKDVYELPLYLTELDKEFNISQIFASYNKEDISYLILGFFKSAKDSIQHADFKTGKQVLSIGGKKVRVTDNMMIINEKNVEKIYKTFIGDLKEDDKLLDILAKSSNIDKKEIVSALEQALNESFDSSDTGNLVVHIFTKGIKKEAVGYKITADKQDIITIVNTNNEFGINIDNMLFKAVTKNGKTYDLSLTSGGMNILTGTYTKYNDTKYDINLDMQGIKMDMNVNANIGKNSTSSDMALKLDMMGQYVTLKYNNETDLTRRTTKYDGSKAKKYDSLDEKEQEEIMTNFAKRMESSSIYKAIKAFDDMDSPNSNYTSGYNPYNSQTTY